MREAGGKKTRASWNLLTCTPLNHKLLPTPLIISNPPEFKPKWRVPDSCKHQGSSCCFCIPSFSAISGKSRMQRHPGKLLAALISVTTSI